MEPNELRAPEAECGEVDPGGGGGDGGNDGDVEDGGVPPVQSGEDHHPTQEEGDQHQEAIDHIGQTFLKKSHDDKTFTNNQQEWRKISWSLHNKGLTKAH